MIPVPVPIVAIGKLLLVQVPEAMKSLRVTDDPAQTENVPAMAAGDWFTLTWVEAVHPPG